MSTLIKSYHLRSYEAMLLLWKSTSHLEKYEKVRPATVILVARLKLVLTKCYIRC